VGGQDGGLRSGVVTFVDFVSVWQIAGGPGEVMRWQTHVRHFFVMCCGLRGLADACAGRSGSANAYDARLTQAAQAELLSQFCLVSLVEAGGSSHKLECGILNCLSEGHAFLRLILAVVRSGGIEARYTSMDTRVHKKRGYGHGDQMVHLGMDQRLLGLPACILGYCGIAITQSP
jgi:hypothetical protein